MARLTKRERAAVRAALASFLADDHEQDTETEFDLDDAERALAKMQERGDAARAGR